MTFNDWWKANGMLVVQEASLEYGFDKSIANAAWNAALTNTVRSAPGWQPIESAPKDVELLVYDPCYEAPIVMAYLALNSDTWEAEWRTADSCQDVIEPTLWISIPPIPSSGGCSGH